MNFSFFTPVKDTVVAHLLSQATSSLGHKINVHTSENGFPDLLGIDIAILGVKEGRGAVNNIGCGEKLNNIREKLYELFPGNWHTQIADLGNIENGATLEDTYFAVKSSVEYLLKNKIIPIIIGGSQDITYANYRGYDALEQTVNLVSVDSKFDLGSIDESISSKSFLSKYSTDDFTAK